MTFKPIAGAVAGIAGTVAMTAALRQINRRFPPRTRHPLPPRQLVEETGPTLPEPVAQETTLLGHAAYGALTGAAMPLLAGPATLKNGALYGGMVWIMSYLGWIPASGLLKSATRHPPAQNLAMVAAHLVWGAVTAVIFKELALAEREIFGGRTRPDAEGAR